MKRIFASIICVMNLLCFSVSPALAGETVQQLILGFEAFDINEHAITFDIADKPALEEVTEYMPDTLTVYLEGHSEPQEIAVDWFCVGENYENSESFYYQFSPSWDEDKYVLFEEIDLLTEAPYIAVFLTSGNTGISTFAVTDNANEVRIYQHLTEVLGYNTAAACGIMANIYAESSFNSNNLQGSYEKKLGFTDESYTAAVDNGTYTNFVNDKAGYGLCQWTYHTRKQGLLNYAKACGVSISDLPMQLNYFESEISVTSVGKRIRAIENTADGAYDAAYDFCENYERPSQTADEKSVYRGNLAKNTYWPEYCNMSGLPYIDVNQSDWFYEAVLVNYENHLMTGMQNTIFAPYESLSRAQFATILYRMDGTPEVSFDSRFEDVTADAWYANAVLWAAQNGIVGGYQDGSFGPADNITREQMALMMHRYAQYLMLDTAPRAELSGFLDAVHMSSFAIEAMQWSVQSGIINGKNNGTLLDPQGHTARAECAAIIYRFMKTYFN